MHIRMIMSEDEIIHFVHRRKFLCKFIKRLILAPEFIFLIMGKTVVP